MLSLKRKRLTYRQLKQIHSVVFNLYLFKINMRMGFHRVRLSDKLYLDNAA